MKARTESKTGNGWRTSRLHQQHQDPLHYRSGRWWLAGEAAVPLTLGVWGLLANQMTAAAGPAGAPVGPLWLTTGHAGLLTGMGVLAAVCTGRRRATTAVTGLFTVAAPLLFTIGIASAAAHRSGLLGFDLRDAWLHGGLLIVNLALLIWLIPDEMGDPLWVRNRSQPAGQPRRADAGTAEAEVSTGLGGTGGSRTPIPDQPSQLRR